MLAECGRKAVLADCPGKRAFQDIDQKIEAYPNELDANAGQDPNERKLTGEELKEKIRLLKERMVEYKGLLRRTEESDPSQISLTDSDACSMPIGGGRITHVGFNIQVAVDPQHKLILDHEVTNTVTEGGLLPGVPWTAQVIWRLSGCGRGR